MGIARVRRSRCFWRIVGLLAVGVIVGLALVGLDMPSAQAARPAASTEPDWLATINYWRAATGLAAVSDQPNWDQGIENHLIYLEKTPASYETGQYASAHTENPASPYYTQSGATEAGYSDLELGGGYTDSEAIDIWLAAPFHVIGMLRAELAQVAFADDPATGYAGLDVVQGLHLPAPTSPVLYPGPGSTTTLARFWGEDPDPTQTCGWQGETVGLPLVVLLPQAPANGLTASLMGPDGTESTANGELCVVDENTYYSSDTVYGPNGAAILRGDNAVLLIPRQPLVSGGYSVSVSQCAIDWSFTAAIPTSSSTGSGSTGTAGTGTGSTGTCTTSSGSTGSGSTGSGNPGPTRTEILKAMRDAVAAVKGSRARIGALLKNRGFRVAVAVPGPGALTIVWDARLDGREYVVATATGHYTHAVKVEVKIALSAVGRRELGRVRSLRITERDVFVATNGWRASSTGALTVVR